jgi:hypothetical protein
MSEYRLSGSNIPALNPLKRCGENAHKDTEVKDIK